MLEKRVEEWSRAIRIEALKEGEQKGEASLLLRLLERKFGRLPAQTRKLVRNADPQRLLAWGDRVLTAERLDEVFEGDS